MALTEIVFVVPPCELHALHAMMEADDTPPCALRVGKAAGPGDKEIAIITEAEHAEYFRKTPWRGANHG